MVIPSAAHLREFSDPGSTIIHCATEEFLAQGYESASIDRIVAAARISKTTFYRHFPSKRAVLEAALEEVLARLSNSFPSPAAAGDLPQTLVRFCRWTRQMASSPEYLGLYRVSVELARNEPGQSQAIHGRVRDRKGPFWNYLEELRRSGTTIRFASDVLNAQFAFLSIGALAMIIPSADFSTQEEERWHRSLAALFTNGYRHDLSDASPSGFLPAFTRPPDTKLESGEELYLQKRSAGMRLSRDDFDTLLSTCAESFLELGYRETALPHIAARTGISRMTLRRQFSSKAELFAASISNYARSLYSGSDPLPMAGEIDVALPMIAQHLYTRFHRPDNIRLLRLMVAQAADFPALAGAVYARSRHNELNGLSRCFAEWAKRGNLGTAWADVAPYHFHTLAINGNAALFRREEMASDARSGDVANLFLDGCLQNGG